MAEADPKFTSSQPSEKSRAIALCDRHLHALEAASALTDMPTTLNRINQLSARVRGYLAQVRASDHGAGSALAMLGRNGQGPAIEAACRSARFHGFDWRERTALMMRNPVSATLHRERGV